MTTPTGSQTTLSLEPVVLRHYSGWLATKADEVVLKARQEAAAHRPPTDAVRMDQNESELRSQAEKAVAEEHQLFMHVLTEASRAAHELQQKVPDVEARIQRVLSDNSLQSEAAVELAEERAALVAAAEHRMRAEVDLRAFRAKHCITEQAVYPESHIWHLALVLAFALVETMANAFFYQNAQGLLGGFMVAAGVAVLNMSTAFALGRGFCYKNLTDRDKRVAGWLCLAAFVVITIYCNALFAAFRANYQTVADPSDIGQLRTAFSAAVEQAGRVFTFRMQFGDFMSFILFGTGLLLSGLAFYKGYTFDDRFPGHGDKDRVAKAARAQELSSQETARQKLKEFLQRRRRELQGLTREPTDLMNTAGQKAAAVQHEHTVFLTQQDAIQRDFALLLRSYRDANAAIRATEPPAYFRDIPDIRSANDSHVMSGVVALLATAHQRAEALRDRFLDVLNSKLNELQRDAAEILDKTFAGFLRSVEQEAEEAINRTTIAAERTSLRVQVGDAI